MPSSNGSGSSNGIVRIGIIGQVGEWKGHDDFLEAARGLKERNLPFACSIYGRGEAGYVESLKAKIKLYELAQQVSWAGFINDPKEIFKRTDICVVPSRGNDPCPTVAIEAAHFGVPIVATRRGGLPELVQDGKTGYLVDAERPEQITEKLKLLIEDGELRRRMAEAARLHGLQNLTRDRMINEMEALLAHQTERESTAE
jgi:glycosyltransferase involved in cell wall biosynthesis